MIVEKRELTGYGRHPFVGSIPHRVTLVPAVVSADPDASGRTMFPGPWGVSC